MISMPEIKKGNNSANNVSGVTTFNLCKMAGHDLEPYQSYRVDTISALKITKGNNYAKNVGGVTVFNLCTSSGHALYCTKFCEIISNSIKVIEQTPFLY